MDSVVTQVPVLGEIIDDSEEGMKASIAQGHRMEA